MSRLHSWTGVLSGACVALCSTGALAQNSVTLYGSIDNGLNYTTNQGGKSALQALSSVKWGSRLGFTGSEDLGGGWAAIFRLENGFNAFQGVAGQGGLLFGRQAYVGLSGPAGTLTLGRQYDSIATYVGALASSDAWAGYPGAHPGDYDNVNDAFRENNAIRYAAPKWNGLEISGLYAPGGVPGSLGRNRIYSIGAGYSRETVTLGLAYLHVDDPATSAYGASSSPVSGGTFTNPVTSPVFSGYASARSLSVFGAAAQYAFGASTVAGVYTYTRFAGIVPTSTTPHAGSAIFGNAELSYRYLFTPSILGALSYDFTNAPTARYHQVNMLLDYFLSKRTDVYLLMVAQKASGIDSTGKAAVAAINGVSASSTDRQLLVRVGINQKF